MQNFIWDCVGYFSGPYFHHATQKQRFWDEIYYQILDLWWVCPGFACLEPTDIPTQHDGFVFKNIVSDPRDHNKHIPDEICFRMIPYKSYPEPHFALSRIWQMPRGIPRGSVKSDSSFQSVCQAGPAREISQDMSE